MSTNKEGSHVYNKVFFKGEKKEVVNREEVKWMVYKDGKLIDTLPSTAQPGINSYKKGQRF